MHSWKKKLVVSQLALACTLAITSQANAANYDTWTYIDNPVTALDWDHMDIMRMLQKQNYLQHVEILCFYEFDACFSP